MKHLFRKAVPDRITWNEHGIVTINDNVVKDSNIAGLINDAMHERKTVKAVGRNQFAQLLRWTVLNILSALVRNKRLLQGVTVNNTVKLRPRATSMIFILKAWVPHRLYREHEEGEKRNITRIRRGKFVDFFSWKTDTPVSLQTGKKLVTRNLKKTKIMTFEKLYYDPSHYASYLAVDNSHR